MTVADFNKCERIVIVGAGVFGLGTAISIKRKFPAKHVTVIERLGIPAPDASSVDLNKVVRCDYGTDVLHTDLANDAIRRFLEWNAEDEKHGRAPLFHPCGVLVLSKEAMDSPESKYEKASRAAMTANGLASHVVDDIVGANRSRLPVAWNRVVDAGAYKDGYLNMWCGFGLAEKTVVRMADEAKSLGVELKPEHPLTKILYSEDGSTVKGVSCSPPGASSPVEIAADYVVVAAGAWSPSILPELSALLMPTGQSVIHYRLNDPIAREHFTEKGGFTVWFADVYRSGFYGFPEESESGLVKVANHSPGYKIPDAAKGPVTFATGGTIVEGSKEIVKSAGKEFTIPRGELHFMREWVKRNLPELEEKGELVSTRVCWWVSLQEPGPTNHPKGVAHLYKSNLLSIGIRTRSTAASSSAHTQKSPASTSQPAARATPSNSPPSLATSSSILYWEYQPDSPKPTDGVPTRNHRQNGTANGRNSAISQQRRTLRARSTWSLWKRGLRRISFGGMIWRRRVGRIFGGYRDRLCCGVGGVQGDRAKPVLLGRSDSGRESSGPLPIQLL